MPKRKTIKKVEVEMLVLPPGLPDDRRCDKLNKIVGREGCFSACRPDIFCASWTFVRIDAAQGAFDKLILREELSSVVLRVCKETD
jgi:hypothetical protein